MNLVTLKAHYEGEKICPDEPHTLAPNVPLLVTVLPGNLLTGNGRNGWPRRRPHSHAPTLTTNQITLTCLF